MFSEQVVTDHRCERWVHMFILICYFVTQIKQ